MVFLLACQQIAGSSLLFRLLLALLVLVLLVNAFISAPLGEYEDGLNVPDGRIAGYTPEELNLWYDRIGVEGCRVYISATSCDFLGIMTTYPLLLGSLLIQLAKNANLSEKLAYIPLVAVAFDVVETYLQRRGCVVYPERMSDSEIFVAGNACRLKWVFLVCSLTLIAVLQGRRWLAVQSRAEAKTE